MEIKVCNKKTKCDILGCKNLADYYIENEKIIFKASMFLCKNCIKDLSEAYSKMVVKKSPKNILNIEENNEK